MNTENETKTSNHISLEYKGSDRNPVEHRLGIQGIIQRPDGSFIRPFTTIPDGKNYPKQPDAIKRLLLKSYDKVDESVLVKAWVVFTKIITEESVCELA